MSSLLASAEWEVCFKSCQPFACDNDPVNDIAWSDAALIRPPAHTTCKHAMHICTQQIWKVKSQSSLFGPRKICVWQTKHAIWGTLTNGETQAWKHWALPCGEQFWHVHETSNHEIGIFLRLTCHLANYELNATRQHRLNCHVISVSTCCMCLTAPLMLWWAWSTEPRWKDQVGLAHQCHPVEWDSECHCLAVDSCAHWL